MKVIGNIFLYLMIFFLTQLSFASSPGVSPLCEDLAKASCAPGSSFDGTGTIKSLEEHSNFISEYTEKAKAILREKIQNIVNSPESSYFKESAKAFLGLKDMPICDKFKGDRQKCDESLADGLFDLAQKIMFDPLLPKISAQGREPDASGIEFILNDQTFYNLFEEMNDQFRKDLIDTDRVKKIKENVYPKVQDLIVDRLLRLNIQPLEQKRLMIRKIRAIRFEGVDCSQPNGRRARILFPSIVLPNAYYDTEKRVFKICNGYLLQSTSEFDLVRTIAHELTHSIDPCNITKDVEGVGFKYTEPENMQKSDEEYPIKNILQCLRNENSVGARNSDAEEKSKRKDGAGGGGTTIVVAPSENVQEVVENNPKVTFPRVNLNGHQGETSSMDSICKRDQAGESLGDWMAMEILPEYMEKNHKLTKEQYINGYINSFKINCKLYSKGDDPKFDVHPNPNRRINNIVLVNPKAREQMGCPSKHSKNIYCDPNKPLKQSLDSSESKDSGNLSSEKEGVR